jgi:hypothetical protein
VNDKRCTFIADEQTHQLVYFSHQFAGMVGHDGRNEAE